MGDAFAVDLGGIKFKIGLSFRALLFAPLETALETLPPPPSPPPPPPSPIYGMDAARGLPPTLALAATPSLAGDIRLGVRPRMLMQLTIPLTMPPGVPTPLIVMRPKGVPKGVVCSACACAAATAVANFGMTGNAGVLTVFIGGVTEGDKA